MKAGLLETALLFSAQRAYKRGQGWHADWNCAAESVLGMAFGHCDGRQGISRYSASAHYPS